LNIYRNLAYVAALQTVLRVIDSATVFDLILVMREIRGSIFFVGLANLPRVVAVCRTLPLAQQK